MLRKPLWKQKKIILQTLVEIIFRYNVFKSDLLGCLYKPNEVEKIYMWRVGYQDEDFGFEKSQIYKPF